MVGDGATIEREVEPYTDVRQVGEDVAAGDLVFPAGRLLRPADVAVLGSVGKTVRLTSGGDRSSRSSLGRRARAARRRAR